MIPATVITPEPGPGEARARRRRFGLDTPLPSDPAIVSRAIRRHLAESRPDALVLCLSRQPRSGRSSDTIDLAAGVPDLLLLLPDGRAAFLAIQTQAHTATRAERAFADLCRARAVPVHVVRSLPEARQVFDRLGIPSLESPHEKEDSVAGRTTTRPRPARP